jgi:hypothetical protein
MLLKRKAKRSCARLDSAAPLVESEKHRVFSAFGRSNRVRQGQRGFANARAADQ